MPSEVLWRLDHGKWIMCLNGIDVLSSDSEMGFVSKITEGWTCEGQLTVLLLNLGLWFCASSPLLTFACPGTCLIPQWASPEKTTGRRLLSLCAGLVLCVLSLLWSLSRTSIMNQIKPKLLKRLRARHGIAGPQSALAVTASCPVSWRLFLSCSGNVVALQKTSSSLCLA